MNNKNFQQAESNKSVSTVCQCDTQHSLVLLHNLFLSVTEVGHKKSAIEQVAAVLLLRKYVEDVFQFVSINKDQWQLM